MAQDWNAVRPHFERSAIAHAATLMPDGAPHSVPVWVGVEGEHLAFFSETGSRKDVNLSADPRVSVSVTDPDEPLDMAFIRGTVVRRVDGDEPWPIIDRIATKYTGGPYGIRSGMVVFLIDPTISWARNHAQV